MPGFDKNPIKSLEIEIRLLQENIEYYRHHRNDEHYASHYERLKKEREKELSDLRQKAV